MTNHVFVYGTLMTGFGSSLGNRDGVALVGSDSITGSLFSVHGSFPGLKLDGAGAVLGELYEILDREILRSLDAYEGCRDNDYSSLYLRQVVYTEGGVETYVYEYNHDVEELDPVADGDWRAYKGAGVSW